VYDNLRTPGGVTISVHPGGVR